MRRASLSSKRISAQAVAVAILMTFAAISSAARAADDAYRPPADESYRPPAQDSQDSYEPERSLDGSHRNRQDNRGDRGNPGGYGEPYPDRPPQGAASREEHYEQIPPSDDGGPPVEGSRGTYTQGEIIKAGHGFFGSVSTGLASAVEWAFQKAGRPNGYILGQDAGGAIVAGVRYGEGTLYTKDAGDHKVFWQGPSVGYDLGAEGSKVMTLVYNLRDVSEVYNRFGGIEGSAYLVGGVSVQLQKAGEVTLAPIRAGVGLRLGANVGYLKYSRHPTWNPF